MFRRTTAILASLTMVILASIWLSQDVRIAAWILPCQENVSPTEIVLGPDNKLWFAQSGANRIGNIDVSGTITEFELPTSYASPSAITAGPDGSIWVIGKNTRSVNRIAKVSPTTGAMTEFQFSDGLAGAQWIAGGPDGNVWFTESGKRQIGKITPLGAVTEFPMKTSGMIPAAITKGSDGNIWFTEEDGSGKSSIAKITPLGTITEYSIPNNSRPESIVLGPDNNIWFTENNAGKIGRIIPSTGAVQEFNVNATNPSGITKGPDGMLWFFEEGGDQRIAKMDINGNVTYYTFGSLAGGMTAGPDGNIWVTNVVGKKIQKISTNGVMLATFALNICQASSSSSSSIATGICDANDPRIGCVQARLGVSAVPTIGNSGKSGKLVYWDIPLETTQLFDALAACGLERPGPNNFTSSALETIVKAKVGSPTPYRPISVDLACTTANVQLYRSAGHKISDADLQELGTSSSCSDPQIAYKVNYYANATLTSAPVDPSSPGAVNIEGIGDGGIGYGAAVCIPSGTPSIQCNNNSDDDGDGLVDYPQDLGCYSATDIDEANPAVDIKINGQNGTISIAPGTPVTISWTSTDAVRCNTGTAIAPWGPYITKATSGSEQVVPTASMTFGLQCAETLTSTMVAQDADVAVILTGGSASCTEKLFDAAKNTTPEQQGWSNLGDGGTISAMQTENAVKFITITDNSTTGGKPLETTVSQSTLQDKNWKYEFVARVKSASTPYTAGPIMFFISDGEYYKSVYLDSAAYGPVSPTITYARTVTASTTDTFHRYLIDYKKNGAGVADDTYDVYRDGQKVLNDITRTENYSAMTAPRILFGLGSSAGQGVVDVSYVRFYTEGCTSTTGPRYQLFTSPTQITWQAAEGACVAKGMHLATIENSADQAEATSTLNGATNVWIGLNDITTEGSYKWISGAPFTIGQWAPMQPNGTGLPHNDCVFTNHDLSNPPSTLWHDVGCDGETFTVRSYLCDSKTFATTSSSAPSGDQCSDGADTDGDSLIDMADPGCKDAQDVNEDDEVCKEPSILLLDLQPPPYTADFPIELRELQSYTYNVTFHTRFTIPTITHAFIKQFPIVWLQNGCGSPQTLLTTAEVAALKQYHDGGGHLILSVGDLAGRTDVNASECTSRVNQIATLLGLSFSGLENESSRGCKDVTPGSGPPLLNNVAKVFRNAAANMTINQTPAWGGSPPVSLGLTAQSKPIYAWKAPKTTKGGAVFLPQSATLQKSCTSGQGYRNLFGMLGYRLGCQCTMYPAN